MRKAWYQLTGKEALLALETDDSSGLEPREAQQRLVEIGPNQLEEKKTIHPITIFLTQFTDFMVLVLLGATVISFLLGEVSDAVTIVAIVIVNAILGFVQEYRAEQSLEALREMTAPTATVRRGGVVMEVAAAELVPGDIVYLEPGSRVAADVRILNSSDLQSDEAALTGESVPVRKRPEVIDEEADLADQSNMLFMGTLITSGRGRGVVISTGMATQMGQIAGLLQDAGPEATPLQHRLDNLGKLLVVVCLLICGVVVFTGIMRGEEPYRMFLAGVSLAVAAIPEGLPAIVTIALAIGVQRMIRRNAIVRKLPAVETLGCATVICADKTGTLTANEMTVTRIVTTTDTFEVSGQGYTSAGSIRDSRGRRVSERGPKGESLNLCLTASLLCNNAEMDPPRGDPTEIALLAAGAKRGLTRSNLEQTYPRLREVPFQSERRRMSTIHEAGEGLPLGLVNPQSRVLVCKGAADTVLDLCSSIAMSKGGTAPLRFADRRRILETNETMGNQALRVLAVAVRQLPPGQLPQDPEQLERNLVFIGLIGMIDPPRPEARDAVRACRRAGIRPVMITGDHPSTAAAIAKSLGLLSEGETVVTGREIENLDDRGLLRVVTTAKAFARVSPQHKLTIVKSLRRAGEIVAMTGDGVNDAPAVKEAHIGVAMGSTGTDVTKEAAAMVLTDDNFASIVAAVGEGRAIYDNIRKFIRYLLSCNVGEVLVMFLASLMGMPLPLLPIQILWVNLVTDGLPAMALGVDPADADVLERPPRAPGESIFARRLSIKILGRGTLIALATLAVFIWGLGVSDGDLVYARTLAFATLVMSQLFHVFDCRSERKSIYDLGLFANGYLVVAVIISALMLLAVVYIPALASVFKTVPLVSGDWLAVILASSLGQIVVGFRRLLIYGRPSHVRVIRQ